MVGAVGRVEKFNTLAERRPPPEKKKNQAARETAGPATPATSARRSRRRRTATTTSHVGVGDARDRAGRPSARHVAALRARPRAAGTSRRSRDALDSDSSEGVRLARGGGVASANATLLNPRGDGDRRRAVAGLSGDTEGRRSRRPRRCAASLVAISSRNFRRSASSSRARTAKVAARASAALASSSWVFKSSRSPSASFVRARPSFARARQARAFCPNRAHAAAPAAAAAEAAPPRAVLDRSERVGKAPLVAGPFERTARAVRGVGGEAQFHAPRLARGELAPRGRVHVGPPPRPRAPLR